MKYLISLFALTFIAFTESCVPDPIDIDVKPADPKLCISSVVLGNNGIVIGLTRSYSPLQQSPDSDTLGQELVDQILVSGATVTISYGNQLDTLIEVSPGIYTNLFTTITEGMTYTVRASDSYLNEEVWAATIMQPEAIFDTVYPYIDRTTTDSLVHFKFTMYDNIATQNFYVVNFIKKVQGDSTFDINSVFAAGSNEVLTEFELYDDQAFTNGVLNKDVIVFSAEQTDTVAVTVSEISQGYYEFLTAMKRSSSIFNQLTGEPITYPSNVEGGFGYFTMHRVRSTLFDLNLY
jgi:Domain of unknown function (DUF4249)